jgi:hypothetical protein
MNRKSLGILAIVIIALMAIVATAGLDNLPRNLKSSIDAAGARLSTDHKLFDEERTKIERAIYSEPALFRTRAAAWQTRIEKGRVEVSKAYAELADLKKLAQEDRRQDAKRVEEGLARLDSLRATSVDEVHQIGVEVERWLGYKRNLPKQLQAMNADYDAVRAFDVESATAGARKAILDWPPKRTDLESRLTGLTDLKTRAEESWNRSADLRAQAGKDDESFDYAGLFQSADQLAQAQQQLKEGAETVNRLAGQLYVNWDKLLLDVEEERQRVRFVRTRYADATLQGGETTQEEKWEPVEPARREQLERNVGMVVAHKPAGKYDSEADTGTQAPGYAYVAPPGQANAYGSWNNGVWSWLPQYLILSQLLRGPSIPPITMGDYGSYQRARQRGDVYYGPYGPRMRSSGGLLRRTIDSVRSGSSMGGGFWREREQPRASSGGYSGSRYQNRGSYSGSRYQSRGGYRSYSRGMGGFRRGRR